MIHRRAFRAMGTDVELLLDAGTPAAVAERAFDDAVAEIVRLEGLLSRFDPASELSRLNEERALEAGPELLELVERAIEARDRTAGRFDPTVHDAVVHAGYDRSFEELGEGTDSGSPAGAAVAVRCGGVVTVDRRSRLIALSPGARLDLGGIAKGWTADRLVSRLALRGPALVNIGGDIAARGRLWPVGLAVPGGDLTIAIGDGGIATSGRDRRRWTRGGEEQHHLIDPATGAPAAGDLLTVTVVASSAEEAEIQATSLFLAGSLDRASWEADTADIPAVLVARDGRTLLAGGLS